MKEAEKNYIYPYPKFPTGARLVEKNNQIPTTGGTQAAHRVVELNTVRLAGQRCLQLRCTNGVTLMMGILC